MSLRVAVVSPRRGGAGGQLRGVATQDGLSAASASAQWAAASCARPVSLARMPRMLRAAARRTTSSWACRRPGGLRWGTVGRRCSAGQKCGVPEADGDLAQPTTWACFGGGPQRPQRRVSRRSASAWSVSSPANRARVCGCSPGRCPGAALPRAYCRAVPAPARGVRPGRGVLAAGHDEARDVPWTRQDAQWRWVSSDSSTAAARRAAGHCGVAEDR